MEKNCRSKFTVSWGNSSAKDNSICHDCVELDIFLLAGRKIGKRFVLKVNDSECPFSVYADSKL